MTGYPAHVVSPHTVDVKSWATPAGDEHRAKCSCGWVGEVRIARLVAFGDARKHKDSIVWRGDDQWR